MLEAKEGYGSATRIVNRDGELSATLDPMEHDESESAYRDEEEIPF